MATYAARHDIDPNAVLAHLSGRFAALEDAIEYLLALATHATPDRQAVIPDALDALRGPYERALIGAVGLLARRGD